MFIVIPSPIAPSPPSLSFLHHLYGLNLQLHCPWTVQTQPGKNPRPKLAWFAVFRPPTHPSYLVWVFHRWTIPLWLIVWVETAFAAPTPLPHCTRRRRCTRHLHAAGPLLPPHRRCTGRCTRCPTLLLLHPLTLLHLSLPAIATRPPRRWPATSATLLHLLPCCTRRPPCRWPCFPCRRCPAFPPPPHPTPPRCCTAAPAAPHAAASVTPAVALLAAPATPAARCTRCPNVATPLHPPPPRRCPVAPAAPAPLHIRHPPPRHCSRHPPPPPAPRCCPAAPAAPAASVTPAAALFAAPAAPLHPRPPAASVTPAAAPLHRCTPLNPTQLHRSHPPPPRCSPSGPAPAPAASAAPAPPAPAAPTQPPTPLSHAAVPLHPPLCRCPAAPAPAAPRPPLHPAPHAPPYATSLPRCSTGMSCEHRNINVVYILNKLPSIIFPNVPGRNFFVGEEAKEVKDRRRRQTAAATVLKGINTCF
ncbi:hypothetical protein B0H14DRAFT_3886336 [Mycena olivaceomarginata]|nr:hypothetical protein B0H14DRAFT_3886336 [Mycena olivaceomarginata]